MQKLTKTEAVRFLLEKDGFTIVTHRRPDGDTLGSAAALCRGLRALGKRSHILHNPEITEKYAPLHHGLTKPTLEQGDVVLCVDVAAPELLSEGVSAEQVALRIDHHKSATGFTPLAWVEHTAAACGQMIFDCLQELGVTLDIPMANALYTAVSTDTGCFRFANTQPETFLVAAACARAGADLPRLNRELFETNSLAKLKLQSWMVENIRFLAGGRFALCALPLSLVEQLGLTEDDLENVSGFPRSIEGVQVAATLREVAHGQQKLSVRAVPGYDASAICGTLGGGGHAGAAGATLEMPLCQAVETVSKMLEGLWTES